MPTVIIEMLEGRTTDQKRAIAKGITEVIVKEANTKAESVTVIMHDVPRDSYATSGTLIADK